MGGFFGSLVTVAVFLFRLLGPLFLFRPFFLFGPLRPLRLFGSFFAIHPAGPDEPGCRHCVLYIAVPGVGIVEVSLIFPAVLVPVAPVYMAVIAAEVEPSEVLGRVVDQDPFSNRDGDRDQYLLVAEFLNTSILTVVSRMLSSLKM